MYLMILKRNIKVIGMEANLVAKEKALVEEISKLDADIKQKNDSINSNLRCGLII
jgi:hypothetical protein